jgi:hypothetical protein
MEDQMEKKEVEKELSSLLARTWFLEDEVNSFVHLED